MLRPLLEAPTSLDDVETVFLESIQWCKVRYIGDKFRIHFTHLFSQASSELIIRFFQDEKNQDLIQGLINKAGWKFFAELCSKLSIQSDSPELLLHTLFHLKNHPFFKSIYFLLEKNKNILAVFLAPFLYDFSTLSIKRFLELPLEKLVLFFKLLYYHPANPLHGLYCSTLFKLICEHKQFAMMVFEKFITYEDSIPLGRKENIVELLEAFYVHNELRENRLKYVENFLIRGCEIDGKPCTGHTISYLKPRNISEEERSAFLGRISLPSESSKEEAEEFTFRMIKNLMPSMLEKFPAEAIERFFQNNAAVFIASYPKVIKKNEVYFSIYPSSNVSTHYLKFEYLVLSYNFHYINEGGFFSDRGKFKRLFNHKTCHSRSIEEALALANRWKEETAHISHSNKLTTNLEAIQLSLSAIRRAQGEELGVVFLPALLLNLKKQIEILGEHTDKFGLDYDHNVCFFSMQKRAVNIHFLRFIYDEILDSLLISQLKTDHQTFVPIILEIQKLLRKMSRDEAVYFQPDNQLSHYTKNTNEILAIQQNYSLDPIDWAIGFFNDRARVTSPEICLFWIAFFLEEMSPKALSEEGIIEVSGQRLRRPIFLDRIDPVQKKLFYKMMNVKIAENIATFFSDFSEQKPNMTSLLLKNK